MTDVRNLFMPTFRNFAYLWGKTIGMCTYDETEKVKNICQGSSSCTFKADRATLSDDCKYWMTLTIDYECVACVERPRRKRTIDFNHVYENYFYCNLNVKLPNSINSCPNQRFVLKHEDSRNPDTVDGAAYVARQAEFRRIHGNTVSTSLHTVFITNTPMTYHYDIASGNCVFDRRATKYNCTRQSEFNWACTNIGPRFASHNPVTGHYLSNLDTQ